MSKSLNIEDLLAKIAQAGDAGATIAKLKPRGLSRAAGKAAEAELSEALAALAQEGSIRGPFKKGAAELYFATDCGPTVDKVCEQIVRLAMGAGIKLLSKKALQGKVKGLDARYFADALKEATAKRAILEVACGASKFYLHRDVAAERFGLAAPEPAAQARNLTFAELADAYRRLRDEQGGFTAVKIFDVIKALEAPQAEVHRLIAEEAKAGRVAIHPTNSVNLPREAMDAALRLPGHAEPFVTFALREER